MWPLPLSASNVLTRPSIRRYAGHGYDQYLISRDFMVCAYDLESNAFNRRPGAVVSWFLDAIDQRSRVERADFPGHTDSRKVIQQEVDELYVIKL